MLDHTSAGVTVDLHSHVTAEMHESAAGQRVPSSSDRDCGSCAREARPPG